jgi:hypothetical protein
LKLLVLVFGFRSVPKLRTHRTAIASIAFYLALFEVTLTNNSRDLRQRVRLSIKTGRMGPNKRQKTIEQNDIPSHLISVKDVSINYLNYLLKEAEDMKFMVINKGGDERLKHRVLASVFYEVR